MEITEEQYARIKDSLPVQRGNVSLTKLQVLNAILYVAEQGCKWRGLAEAVRPLAHDLYAYEPVGEKRGIGPRLQEAQRDRTPVPPAQGLPSHILALRKAGCPFPWVPLIRTHRRGLARSVNTS